MGSTDGYGSEDKYEGDGDDNEPDQGDDVGVSEQSASSSVALKKKITRARRERKEAIEFWSKVMGDRVGRREIWRLLQSLRTFEERFACGPNGFPQTEATWFYAGEQAFGLRLYQSLLIMAREGVLLMHDEHDSRFSIDK